MGRKLLVIGGSAAGLSAASKVKRSVRDVEVTVYEKSGYASVGACGLPYFVGNVVQTPEELIALSPKQLADRGIQVHYHHAVTSIDRENQTVQVQNLDTGEMSVSYYDDLVIATGAAPIIPNIPGIHGENVHLLRNMEDGIAIKSRVQAGLHRAVIVGGGLIGLEVAENLIHSGVGVDIVEAMPQLLSFLPQAYSQQILQELEANQVSVHLGNGVSQILVEDGRAVGVQLADGSCIPCDLVLISVGVRPNTHIAAACGLPLGFKGSIVVDETQRTCDPHIWACGDCVEMHHLLTGEACNIPLGTTANKQGRITGSNIAGEHTLFRGVLGSTVSKVFDLYVAATGLSLAKAKEAGFDCAQVSIEKGDKASYYPGSETCYLTLVFERNSGRILGAQGIGPAAIVGRINLLVAAITMAMTVHTLNELDLLYTPSVAPVYDPLLIAAAQAVKVVGLPGR